jgi:hypothetical protein
VLSGVLLCAAFGVLMLALGHGAFDAMIACHGDPRGRDRITLHVVGDALELYRLKELHYPKRLLDLTHAPSGNKAVLDVLPKDAWGHDIVWYPSPLGQKRGCLLSRGADGELGTDDDIVAGDCDRRLLNEHLLINAGLTGNKHARDAYGRPIKLIPQRLGLLAWSLGEDGIADTADDQVARIASKAIGALGAL